MDLCVFREDPIYSALSTLKDKTTKGMAIRVRRADTADEARGCQVLFVGRGEQARLGFVARALAGNPVLLVSDAPDSAQAGAAVEVLLEGRHIAFKINRLAATEANLKLSAQLLGLAKAVYDK